MDPLKSGKQRISSYGPAVFTEIGGKKDFFSVAYDKQSLLIRYSNLQSALFAFEQIESSLKKGISYPEGEYVALVPTRALIPTVVDEALIIQAIKAGFNAVVVENEESTLLAKKWGLKAILKAGNFLNALPFDPDYKEKLKHFIRELPTFDSLYWESPYFALDCKSHLLEHAKLKVELLLEELAALEALSSVFYVIPEKYTLLEQHAGPNTHLVVSSDIARGLNEAVPLILRDKFNSSFISIEGAWEEGSYYACHVQAAGAALFGVATFEESGWDWLSVHRPEISKNDRPLLDALARLVDRKQRIKNVVPDELKMVQDVLSAEMKLFTHQLLQWQKSQDPYRKGKFIHEVECFLDVLQGK